MDFIPAKTNGLIEPKHGNVVVEPVGLEIWMSSNINDSELLAIAILISQVPFSDANGKLARPEPVKNLVKPEVSVIEIIYLRSLLGVFCTMGSCDNNIRRD